MAQRSAGRMRMIGLIGGMSWESSAEYYRLANELVRDRLGGFHSARCLLYSLDFAEIERLQQQASWDEAATALADATAAAVGRGGVDRVGLLGTRFTMEQAFLRERLEQAGLEVLLPDAADRELVHRVIYDELVVGTIRGPSRQRYGEVIARLVDRGAQGVILGCTEIELLIGEHDVPVPVFPTTRLHIQAAVDAALT